MTDALEINEALGYIGKKVRFELDRGENTELRGITGEGVLTHIIGDRFEVKTNKFGPHAILITTKKVFLTEEM